MTDASDQRPQGAGLGNYLKEAFLFRWNVLAFVGATVAGLLSPAPDIVVPLVMAGELAFLAGLTSIPRFRAAIDAKVHAQNSPPLVQPVGATISPQTVTAMVDGLNPKARQRFDQLRARCLSMQRIAHGVLGRTGVETSRTDDLRTPALDKLLWVFLRLLYSQHALAGFLASADEAAMRKGLDDLRQREAAARQKNDERIVRSLQDSIATGELRLSNYQKARSNAEFVGVELDRIEGKIQALTEMAVGHQDPDFISNQVDSVAASVTHTEEAMRELNAITGLTDEMAAPPSILQAELPRAIER